MFEGLNFVSNFDFITQFRVVAVQTEEGVE